VNWEQVLSSTWGLGGLTAALTLLLIALLRHVNLPWRPGRPDALSLADQMMGRDPVFTVLADSDNAVVYRNEEARKLTRMREAETVQAAVGLYVANANPLISRMRARIDLDGACEEEVPTRQGRVRVTGHKTRDAMVIWRVDPRAGQPAGPAAGDTTALPMMTVGRSNTILYMNEPMRALIGERAKALDRVFPVLPVTSGAMNSVSTPDGPRECLLAEAPKSGGRRDIYLLPDAMVEGQNDWGALDDLPVPLLKIAPDGAVLLSNRLAREQLQDAIEPGTRLNTLLEGLGRPITDWLGEVAEHRAASTTEFLRVSHGEKERFVQVTLKRVVDQGAPVIIAVLHDATELKTLEAQFVQSQKMQAIGQLAGGVAHDFNNLLTAISGHCDLLLLRHDQGDPDYGDLVQINQNANRAAALVGQLLAFSRKQTLRPEQVDLRETLADLTHLLNRLVGEKVALTLTHDPVLKSIRADKRQLEQVLMNLVVNARDAMPEGGEILIETEVLSLDAKLERDRATVPPGEYVSVKVSDQGIGIPADKLQKVFEPFYTSKRTGEGTGLGLSTAYGIVKQTGGFIFVDSVVGVGTSFTLLFPTSEAAEPAEAPAAPPPPAEILRQGEGVVMLVEDEAPVRAFASRALRLRGYTVLEAASAEEALETLQDSALEVDVFVTDVIMPGMDGPSWVRKALERRPDTKVVFVSGYAEDAFADDKGTIPNSVFLPKPFSLNDLTATVQRQLH